MSLSGEGSVYVDECGTYRIYVSTEGSWFPTGHKKRVVLSADSGCSTDCEVCPIPPQTVLMTILETTEKL
jgi:hypothetical protein